MAYTSTYSTHISDTVTSPFRPEDVRCTPRRWLAYVADTVVLCGIVVGVSIVAGWWQTTTVDGVNQLGQAVPVS
jgi:hypothetical protein